MLAKRLTIQYTWNELIKCWHRLYVWSTIVQSEYNDSFQAAPFAKLHTEHIATIIVIIILQTTNMRHARVCTSLWCKCSWKIHPLIIIVCCKWYEFCVQCCCLAEKGFPIFFRWLTNKYILLFRLVAKKCWKKKSSLELNQMHRWRLDIVKVKYNKKKLTKSSAELKFRVN